MSGRFLMLIFLVSLVSLSKSQNPLITDQFTADPSTLVVGDRLFVFPSHDILCTEDKGRVGWFCMEDYHVFSTENLVDWTDHGVILTQNDVKWVDTSRYAMWAPDCTFHKGKYYFYFPAIVRDTTKYWSGFGIGVAVSNRPDGEFEVVQEPIANVKGIDPNVFFDKDGTAYLYWSRGEIYGAQLKDNMMELASEPVTLRGLPDEGLKEGPYVFERNGVYYLTYPHVENKTKRLEYAISDNPLGPFEVKGVIMDESPTGCWTNHQSIVKFKGQWYLFYHHNDFSPEFDKNRAIRADSLFFDGNGGIQKVIPSFRGVGVCKANSRIQIDRYSAVSDDGVSIDFIDDENKFLGWKAGFDEVNAWLKFNSVDFSSKSLTYLRTMVMSKTGGTLVLQNESGEIIAKIQIPVEEKWSILDTRLKIVPNNIHNLKFSMLKPGNIELDWVEFH